MAKKVQPNHCRLSVFLAADAPKGVILRRGPSEWVQLILWDTATDTFTTGQWFKGRIYDEKCDLSPDGSKFIYFAAKHGKYGKTKDGYTPTWTAISRPPYFTALALWPDNSGTWGGGGYFRDNRTVCQFSCSEAHPNHQPPTWFRVNTDHCTSDTPRFWRMLHSGWTDHIQIPETKKKRKGYGYPLDYLDPTDVYQRDSTDGAYTLTMEYIGYQFAQVYGDPRIMMYWVQHKKDGAEFVVSDTWADWDHRGRLVYVEEGKLLTAQLGDQSLTPQVLRDFNPNRPELIQSPRWASVWERR